MHKVDKIGGHVHKLGKIWGHVHKDGKIQGMCTGFEGKGGLDSGRNCMCMIHEVPFVFCRSLPGLFEVLIAHLLRAQLSVLLSTSSFGCLIM